MALFLLTKGEIIMKNKFGIHVQRQEQNFWSFGISLCHMFDETYIYIGLFKLDITIGKFYH